MDQSLLAALIVAAVIGIVAVILILGRTRRAEEAATRESPFGTSTEGEKRCPACGMGNLWTATTCSACGEKLPG